jgi:hypothetical protein
MAERIYRSPVGTNLDGITGIGWHIAGIQIDNPSGSWLFVTAIDQYVPPYRVGWKYPVSPQASSLSVRFVDSPSGSVSELVGDPITVTVYDVPIPTDHGNTSGAGGRVSIEPANLIRRVNFVAIEAGSAPISLNAALVGFRIVPVRFTVFALLGGVPLDPLDAGVYAIRTPLFVQWQGGTGAQILVNQGLSPAKPSDTLDVTPKAFSGLLAAGEEIVVWGATANGGGAQELISQLQYYHEAV